MPWRLAGLLRWLLRLLGRRLAAGLAVGDCGGLGVVVIEIRAVVAVTASPSPTLGIVVVRRLLVDVLIGLFG